MCIRDRTGSAGFIGKALCQELRKRAVEVIEIDRVTGQEASTIGEYLKDGDVACVFHLAAQTSVFNDDLAQIRKDNIDTFMIVAEMCIRDSFTPNYMGKIGFPSYSITNNGANIRRVKGQLEKAKQMKVTEDKEYKIGNVRVVENYQENRLQLFFPGKPDENVRTQLKHNGFRWSRFNGCWQSYLKRWQIERAKEIIGG